MSENAAPPAPVPLLLVEDNPADARLVQEVLRESRFPNALSVVRDGVEALAFLRREAPFQDAPRPRVVLLDLDMPRMDGRELLGLIRSDPALRRIPVVVMSASPAESDIGLAYDRHANCYVRKPIDYQRLQEVLRSIEEFWLSTVELPER